MGSTKTEAVDHEGILQHIRKLKEGSATKLEDVDAVVGENSPQQLITVLARYVFLPDEQLDSTLTPSEALHVMFAIVGKWPEFITLASTLVYQEAKRLQNATDEKMSVPPELIVALVDQLKGSDTTVADNASKTIVLCALKTGTNFVGQVIELIVTAFKMASSFPDKTGSSTACVRCASCLVDLVVKDDAFMVACIDQGATSLLTELICNTEDPLLQISALDLFTSLASTKPFHETRARWLLAPENRDVGVILQLAGAEVGSEPDPMLGAAALQVVAALCKALHAHTDSHNGALLESFRRALVHWTDMASSDLDRLSIVDAISSLAASSDATLAAILDDKETRTAWLSLNAQSKLKSAILVSISQVINARPGESSLLAESSHSLRKRLFASLGPTNRDTSTMDMLMRLVKSPIPEIRVGSYALFEAAAMLSNGASQVMLMHPEFLDHILTRGLESTLNGRIAKHAVVQAIVSDNTVMGLLSDDIGRKLEKYVSEGPHYQQAKTWDVATE